MSFFFCWKRARFYRKEEQYLWGTPNANQGLRKWSFHESLFLTTFGSVSSPILTREEKSKGVLLLVALLVIGVVIVYPFIIIFGPSAPIVLSPSPSSPAIPPSSASLPFFVYVNDIHLDPLYRPFSRVTDESRCRTNTTNPIKPYPFGQYGC
jgi:hypothetical protein